MADSVHYCPQAVPATYLHTTQQHNHVINKQQQQQSQERDKWTHPQTPL